jgi:dextranase
VGNWPIEALAGSEVAFLYIEIWPPNVEYVHLAEIVLNAVRLSHGKAVVIALYLPADRPANNLLADAVILACGGTRIELGENGRLLSDPYFPKHEEISPRLAAELRRLSDFAVRNGEYLMPYNLSPDEKEVWSYAELNPGFISTDPALWTLARKYPGQMVVHLVNFSGLDPQQRWDEAHEFPVPCQNVKVKAQLTRRPSKILWDIPEKSDGPQELYFEYEHGTLTFQVPQINITGLVAIHE